MSRFIALTLAVLSFNSFAADAATCERSVKNVFDIMYASPKDKEKLKSDAVQAKMKKDIAKCSSTPQAVAECHAKSKSFDEIGKCPKQ